MKKWHLTFVLVLAFGCGKAPDNSGHNAYNPVIKPANFVAHITNQYFPLVPGTVFKYSSMKEGTAQDVTITVTSDTKVILGVTCTVIHDEVTEGAVLVEDTYDWYAQDKDGNVWYFGEDTKSYDNGQVSTEGSWQAGVHGAKPGIVVEGIPKVGDKFRQEYQAGVAEDRSEVLSLTASATSPYGNFSDCMETKDYSALEPGVIEHKFFCPNVGQVQTIMVEGGNEHEELVSITP